jgi:hypothetical protein
MPKTSGCIHQCVLVSSIVQPCTCHSWCNSVHVRCLLA